MKNIKLRRIIGSGKFIPEIDGLRFIAILSVVLYHIHIFLRDKNLNGYSSNQNTSYAPDFIVNGSLGVELFFVISGFILGLYFAKAYQANRSPNIKSYFIRRLTRLEPPYIIALLLLFFGSIYIAKTLSFSEALSSLIASIFYSHNIIYPGTYPKLMTVAWSLEVEIQFYILAPILGLIFKLKKQQFRILIMASLAILFCYLPNNLPLGFVSIYNYLAYFLLGFILTDLYVFGKNDKEIESSGAKWIGSAMVLVLLYIFYKLNIVADSNYSDYYTIGHLIILFVIFYLTLFYKVFPILSHPWITNIGGACYSIYLLHFPIISLFGNPLVSFQISNNKLLDNLIYGLILGICVLIMSGIFYVWIERPCMKKDWYKNIFRKSQN